MIKQDILMKNKVIEKAVVLIIKYLQGNYVGNNYHEICDEIYKITNCIAPALDIKGQGVISYSTLQDALATINEKEYIRKSKGVYYTPADVVNFTIHNCEKVYYDEVDNELLSSERNKQANGSLLLKTVFDPTCGAGEFLVAFLNIKLNDYNNSSKSKNVSVRKIVSSIYGNDINEESTTIAKLRLFLCVLKHNGIKAIKGIADILNSNFTNYDFVKDLSDEVPKFDIIVGNPPYVEDSKCDTPIFEHYGNIYCNVLNNALQMLKNNGVMGFIIPISYISTPRMSKIRAKLGKEFKKQFILTYADRPDCLFTSVHQKLCILIGQKGKGNAIYSSKYHYWYKQERETLFDSVPLCLNTFSELAFIPKLGSEMDRGIYKKIAQYDTSLSELLMGDGYNISLNMRACFWIKAFTSKHNGAEYKHFSCNSKEEQLYTMALLNSSLFWWYWVCVSDCWHITKKELQGFMIPPLPFESDVFRLAQYLENRLELTKKYVGTKQTEYEYKHRNCLTEIEKIDDAINKLYGLNETESAYIKNFARKYRLGGSMDE